MAANRATQQKRRSGCLKGGAAAEASASPSPSDANADDLQLPGWGGQSPVAPRYALSMLDSGLKIRLTARRELHEELEQQGPDNDSKAAAASPKPEPMPMPPELLESDGEELLEEGGDSDIEDAAAPQLQTPPPPRNTVEIVYTVDSVQLSASGTIDFSSSCPPLSIKRLIPIASVPLGSTRQPPALATVRGAGLGLARLVDRMYDRQLGLLADADYGEGEGEFPLLLLPAARLPWASLTVHRLPEAAPAASIDPAPPPDWWLASDGPDSEVNLNSLRRSNIFRQQFG
ncbi:hypothetical protein BOX15_Mlig009124g1 [Macrostomum lignano]|uniref:Uncharacterized protein n=2 Tax=Macrostomum lignano TaxID=282301 RepID=A0A267DUB9_9PLAT|nr:hypothetical protein BOX15_Mlig009124g2 [Macrostomum lignano]PAA52102.1 hypothetical protein BOX15_Mlig009124g1 [Macrostomum lignano]